MPHPTADHQLALPLQLQSTPRGIEVIAITAGLGNGWEFEPAVLQASVPLWNKASCYADHTSGSHSVRDLGGILSEASWDHQSQGVRALLTPFGNNVQPAPVSLTWNDPRPLQGCGSFRIVKGLS